VQGHLAVSIGVGAEAVVAVFLERIGVVPFRKDLHIRPDVCLPGSAPSLSFRVPNPLAQAVSSASTVLPNLVQNLLHNPFFQTTSGPIMAYRPELPVLRLIALMLAVTLFLGSTSAQVIAALNLDVSIPASSTSAQIVPHVYAHCCTVCCNALDGESPSCQLPLAEA
jgi:hypothetical protein